MKYNYLNNSILLVLILTLNSILKDGSYVANFYHHCYSIFSTLLVLFLLPR